MMTGPMLSSGLRGNRSMMGRGDRSSLSNRSTLGGLPMGGVINKAYMQGI